MREEEDDEDDLGNRQRKNLSHNIQPSQPGPVSGSEFKSKFLWVQIRRARVLQHIKSNKIERRFHAPTLPLRSLSLLCFNTRHAAETHHQGECESGKLLNYTGRRSISCVDRARGLIVCRRAVLVQSSLLVYTGQRERGKTSKYLVFTYHTSTIVA